MTKKAKPKPVPSLVNYFGLTERQFPRHLLGSETGDLLIVGGGRCVWEDVRGACETPNVMTVNDMLMYWPGRIKHAYSNDIEQLIHWSCGRRRSLTQIYSGGWQMHSCTKREGDEYKDVIHWPIPSQGSSGLVAIFIALLLGYDHVTVAGVPLDNDGHFFDPPNNHPLRRGREWSNFYNETPDALIERALPFFRGKVQAISGRLKEALG